MKLSDIFDCTEGADAACAVDAAMVEAAEMEDDETDGAGGELPLFAVVVKFDINVDDDDFIESSMDAADDETDLYMESSLDEMLSSLAHVRSLDAGFLCLGCFDIVDAIF
jgi:hypothetical protein